MLRSTHVSPHFSWDSVPHGTLTPQEPLVEALGVASDQNVILVMNQEWEKSFLIPMMLKEFDLSEGFGLLLLSNSEQVRLWKQFLGHLLHLPVQDELQCVEETFRGVALCAFPPDQVHAPNFPLSKAKLILVDNAQSYLTPDSRPDLDRFLAALESNPYCHPPPEQRRRRLLGLTTHLLRNPRSLTHMDSILKALEAGYPGCQVEATCDLISLLRYLTAPNFNVILYDCRRRMESHEPIEREIRRLTDQTRHFLETHQIDMSIYKDFMEPSQACDDPAALPLQFLDSFVEVLDTFGIWAAERAAHVLEFKIQKLTTCEKYERNYLLLNLLHSQLSWIRKICKKAFEEVTETERITNFTKPKLLKLRSALLHYKPAHIGKVPIEATEQTKQGEPPDEGEEALIPNKREEEEEETQEAVDEKQSNGEKDNLPQESLAPKVERKDRTDGKKRVRIEERSAERKEKKEPEKAGSKMADNHEPTLNKCCHRKGSYHSRGGRNRRNYHRNYSSSYDDPNALHCVIFVKDQFHAKIVYHFLRDLSRSENQFSFLTPQYIVSMDEEASSLSGVEEAMERKKQEDSLRRFRMKESNILVSNYCLEAGIENVRCNLIIAFDPPENFHDYSHQKVKGKAQNTSFLIFSEPEDCQELLKNLAFYEVVEERLKSSCSLRDDSPSLMPATATATAADSKSCSLGGVQSLLPVFQPGGPKIPGACLATSLVHVNRYCARLPSDTFTRLTPLYKITSIETEGKKMGFLCAIQLPINSQLKSTVCGTVPMPSKSLARQAAALEVCKRLHALGELDDAMVPTGKELLIKLNPVVVIDESESKERLLGTTKRRQYYYKQVAPSLQGILPVNKENKSDISKRQEEKEQKLENDGGGIQSRPTDCYYFRLYSISLKLICPIPADQNTRGRKVYPPEESEQSFGFLVQDEIPPVCPFPIYTRSGEVLVELELLEDGLALSADQLDCIVAFHKYTFSDVLRLHKYPMQFHPEECESSILVLPLTRLEPSSADGDEVSTRKKVVDWDFLQRIRGKAGVKLSRAEIEEGREEEGFVFDEKLYEDAVIMPWYRNQDQPQYFYVAEICRHLSPKSDFPGQGFESFQKYYQSKYSITIRNLDQPLLDVDHTSARLNFLTPRYVNRKGVALPTSSEETKKNKRENLDQKQILIPELCAIHPFKASLWRQTVSLPCILYRINGLLIADQLRFTIASELKFGRAKLERGFKWKPLDFGWTLADVLKNRSSLDGSGVATESKNRLKNCINKGRRKKDGVRSGDDVDDGDGNSIDDQTKNLVRELREQEHNTKNKDLNIGTWDNEMLKEDNITWNNRNNLDGELCDEDEDESALLEGQLPQNLFIMDPTDLSSTAATIKGKGSWGMGIDQKSVPCSNNEFNIPGGFDECESDEDFDDDDLDDEDDDCDNSNDELEEDEYGGNVKYNGDSAETCENSEEEKKRIEDMAKDRAEVETMMESIPWQVMESEGCGEEEMDRDLARDVDMKLKALKEQANLIIHAGEEWEKIQPDPLLITTASKGSDKERIGCFQEGANDFRLCQEFLSAEARLKLELNYCQVLKTSSSLEKEGSNHFGLTKERQLRSEKMFSFDEQPCLDDHPGPSPSLILQAITMSNSNDAINLERLETIGDSFLKYAITTYLFCRYDDIHEGKLSHLRSKRVSNVNLYQLGRIKKMGERMIATKFDPHDNWLPPGYRVAPGLENAIIQSKIPPMQWNKSDMPQTENEADIVDHVRATSTTTTNNNNNNNEKNNPAPRAKTTKDLTPFVPYNLLTQHSIPDKSIADCVEALIGAYLISCGPRGGLLFMTWLGLSVLPEKDDGSPGVLSLPPSPLLRPLSDVDVQGQLDFLLRGYDEFEASIGYRFKDRSYLLQAFSHASYHPNRLTDCYQRLEFLGDAVLDYLITRFLYEDPRKHSPGALTDLRSALVNNTIFASLAVKNEFHKFFRHLSPALSNVINRFVRIYAKQGFKLDDHYLIEEDETEEAEDVEVPKALGDIFESVAGAIYLDSGLSLDTVWAVYYAMMEEEIELFSTHVPKSPIRELLELEPETAKFGKPEKLADGRRVRVVVDVFGKGTFKGIGRNYRIAKCTAAKCALRAIKMKKNATAGQQQ